MGPDQPSTPPAEPAAPAAGDGADGTDLVVGVDVGGTKTLALAVELDGAEGMQVLDRELVPSDAGTDRAVRTVTGAVERLVRRCEDRDGRRPRTVGVGLAGFVDRSGVVRRAPNTAGLVGVDVGAELSAVLGVPVAVDNDANCVAVAAHHDTPPDTRHLVAITLGTGIGGGLVVGGRLVRGANGFAGEPGHMVIDPSGPPCPCGQRGCWERFASGKGLAMLARRAVEDGRAPAVLAAAGSVEDVRGEHVTDLLAGREPGAVEVFTEYAGYVALGVANLVLLLDPQMVVIGGGISAHGELLGELLAAQLEAHFPSVVVDRDVEVVVTPGGPEAGAIGAALLGAGRMRTA